MTCSHLRGDHTQKLEGATDLGYSLFGCCRCWQVQRTYWCAFQSSQGPVGYRVSSVVFRLLFKLRLHDLVRIFPMRGYEFSHETVREREERFATLLAEHLRRKGKEKAEAAGTSTKHI